MRYVRYAFLAALAVVLISVAMANRQMIELSLLPKEVGGVLGLEYSLSLPLFVVIFAAVIAGLLIGFLWEWLREHKHRADLVRKESEVRVLKRELDRAKGGEKSQQDEVLALLEKTG